MRNQVARSLLFMSVAIGIAGFYQNCAPMTALSGQFEGSSVTATAKVILDADVSWSMKENRPLFNRFNRAERWANAQSGRAVNLYPPFIPSTTTLNYDNSGVLEVHAGREFIRLNPEASLSPAVADVSEFIFDRTTMFMLINDVHMPVGTAEPLRLFGLWPQNGDQAGVLVIDVAPAADGALEFTAVDWFGADYATRKITVTAAEAKAPIAVGVRFDKSAGSMQIAINGRLAEAAVATNGNVPPLGLVTRSFTVHAPANTYGSKGSFLLGEFAIYKQALSDYDLIKGSAQLALSYGGAAVVPTPEPTPIITLPQPGDNGGAALYETHCQTCHSPLAISQKRGRTAAQISNAINLIAGMSALGSLSTADREKIAEALK